MKISFKLAIICSLFSCSLLSPSAFAATPEFTLTIKDHLFTPAELKIPAGKKIKLIVYNKDDTAEEFESHELNREKVIPAHSKAPLFIGPLTPGKYPYIGEFHPNTAHGILIAE